MWHLGRDCLPIGQRLNCKGVECTSNCVICQSYTKYNWHLFLVCADSITCWRKVNIWSLLEELMDGAESFGDVFTRMWQRLLVEQLMSFSMTSWSIWKKRNLKLWKNKIESLDQILQRAQVVLNAWEWARRVQQSHTMTQQQTHATVWQPPRAGLLKCNVDATIFTVDRIISMGAGLTPKFYQP
ncbi:hypothetical protein MTR_8g031330 [Medicago truncatula]|uniref:Reverse transcriptase zinc-binding domain-containing protein n=1 Tax=Medicago truncatula TaxID=3880 RepID=A0A072TNZ9_MEDTR|nr:hypothetical protein MTR_8g031330 [Medicago truncatula]